MNAEPAAIDAPAQTGLEAAPEAMTHLQGRNQFVLGPHVPPEFESWPRVTIGRSLALAAHPSLDVTQASGDGRRLTCVGFMLDPFNPERSDAGILAALLAGSASRAALLEQIGRLGGRWVLLVEEGESLWLVNDTLGYRQLFFADSRHAGQVWCASHPRVLAEALGAARDPAAAGYVNDMLRLNPDDVLKQRSRWWPGIGSPYLGIQRLTPNHYLDLCTQTQHRFWPAGPVAPVTLEQAVDAGAPILEGTIQAARTRFDEMTLMITAGLDSRLVLASCRSIAGELRYVTLAHPKGATRDVTLPRNLLPKLGLRHDLANAAEPDDAFRRLYEQTIVMPNSFYASNAAGLLPFFERRRVGLNGVATGVFTGHYRLPWPANVLIKRITPEILTRMLPELENHPFAVAAIREWMDGLGNTYNYDVLDLFFWEQRTPNWNSDWAAGYDLIWKDTVMPYNCRHLYELFLGVPEPLRRKPRAALHKGLMRRLWPEVLDLADPPPQMPLPRRIKRSLANGRKQLRQNIALLR